ncbi:hypothetical protein QR680_015337 [Steinernema hermaphroditum]|uniref:Uncharacterized protein n=1 Tax=Steinernema hermaphroditum TaxID=289476 RepID=A0AA39LKN1_9BILA|nr:hypothetical protein QR680_015337 [Steinernema hermaphroditum]
MLTTLECYIHIYRILILRNGTLSPDIKMILGLSTEFQFVATSRIMITIRPSPHLCLKPFVLRSGLCGMSPLETAATLRLHSTLLFSWNGNSPFCRQSHLYVPLVQQRTTIRTTLQRASSAEFVRFRSKGHLAPAFLRFSRTRLCALL